MRCAMMLRWISAVPPAIVLAKLNWYWLIQGTNAPGSLRS